MSDRPELEIVRAAPVTRTPLGDGRSWVDLRSGFARDPEGLLEHVLGTTDWYASDVWRFDHYVEERRLGAMIRAESTAALRQTGMHLDAAYRVKFSGVTAIHYRTGQDFQGLHSDREMKWLDETMIAILVLGEARPFVLRPRRSWTDPDARGDASEDVVVHPGHGDLLVMGGRCQRDWLHGVPAHPTDRSRVSLTWRWTSRRGRPDTGPTYYDGKHYSGGPQMPGSRRRRVGP